MKRHNWFRNLVFLVCFALGAATTACEAILDFDRTPLQPVPEASAPEEEEEDIPDARPDRGSSSGGQDSGKDSGPQPKDSGKDADGDANP